MEQRPIFVNDTDRGAFLGIVGGAVMRFRWQLHAYVLMGNHFHLLVETVEPTLSRGMQKLEGDYARHFNWSWRRVGHLFQGRFKSHLIDSDRYFLEVARYIVMNPVRARLVDHPAKWAWGSYRTTAGIEPEPEWLTTSNILARFDANDRAAACRLYRDFISARLNDCTSPWDDLIGQIYLGGDGFIEQVERRIAERTRSGEYPRPQRIPRCRTVGEVKRAVFEAGAISSATAAASSLRLAFALLARTDALATLTQIASALSIGVSGASYLVRRAEELSRCDESFATLLDSIRARLTDCKL